MKSSLIALAVALVLVARPAPAATPGSVTISNGSPSGTWTGTISGAGTGENTCIDGVSCDSLLITLAPGDYTGKQINVTINWIVPAYDYDLYVHVGTLRGPVLPSSAGPPPATQEQVHIGIDPPVVTTPRVWWAHVQAATVPPAQSYSGSVNLVAAPPSPVVAYLPGKITFSRTVPLYARGTVRTEEPSVRVDVRGNCYVGGIRGAPAGVDMWRFDLDPSSPAFDPEMRNAFYLGQPDVFQQQGAEDSTAGGADGGGDIEIATSFPTDSSLPVMSMVSLAVADISANVSSDRGTTWQHNGAAAAIPSDDRQWIEADGPNNVYLFYRAPVPSAALFVQKSTDHGLNYGAPVPVIAADDPAGTTPGYIDVDHANGYVYVSHQNDNALYVSRSTDGGATFTTKLVDGLTAHGHLFDPVKVGDDGTVYVAWSNDRHIYYSFSLDHGDTWTNPAAVENPDSTLVNVFPWLEAGSAGRLDVVWYGTKSSNISAAQWDVYFSQSLNANSASPTFRQQKITEHRIHGSNISEGGLTGAANRNLGDYFQIAYDPQGAAVIAFADDHNDFDGNTFVVRQLDGPSILASANGTGTVNPVPRTELPLYSWSEPEVVDPVHDAVLQVQPIPTDSPFDIKSIKYFADTNGPNAPYIGARMTLSGLAATPPDGLWRIAFTANSPWVEDQLPYGVSDHGDMFYLLASDSSGTPHFSYGTAYRDSTPLVPVLGAFAMAYNAPIGFADSGYVDTTTQTVTIKIAASKINAVLAARGRPLIAEGSWLSGLRGSAGAVGNGPRDNTRGGRFNFYVAFNGPTAVEPTPLVGTLALSALPNPMRDESEIRYSLPIGGHATLGIYDARGRLVRNLVSGPVTAGAHVAHWDGRTSGGSPAGLGVYFAALQTETGETVTKIVRMR